MSRCQEQCEGLACGFKLGSPIEEERELELEEQYIDKLRLQREKIESLRREFQLKEEELSQRNSEIQRLNCRVESLEQFRLSYEELLPKFERLAFQFRKAAEHRAKLEDELGQLLAKDYPAQLAQLKESLSLCQNDKSIQQLRIAKLESDLARTVQLAHENELKQRNTQLSIKIKIDSLKSELERLASENGDLQQERERLMSEQNYSRAKTEEREEQMLRLQDYLAGCREQLAAKDSELCRLRSELDGFRVHHHKEMSEKTISCDKVAADLRKANSLAGELRLRVEQLESRNHDISCALERCTQQSNRLSLENKQVKVLLENSCCEESGYESEIRALRKKLLERDEQLKSICEGRQEERRERHSLSSKRKFNLREKAAQIERMQSLLREMDEQFGARREWQQ